MNEPPERSIPALIYEPGDPPTKFTLDADLVVALVGEGEGGLLFKGLPLAEVAEVFLGIGTLLHQAATNPAGREAILEVFRTVQKVTRGETLAPGDSALLAQAPARLARLMPCEEPGCRWCAK